jgi:hypothetical protein
MTFIRRTGAARYMNLHGFAIFGHLAAMKLAKLRER